MTCIRSIYLALVFLLSHLALATEKPQIVWDSLKEPIDYTYAYLNAQNGLLQNEIKDMFYHPKSKVLWLGTQQGLVRYSGRKVEVLSPRNNAHLYNARIRDFYSYRDSAWIVYGDNNAYCEVAADGIHLQESKLIREEMLFSDRGNLIPRTGFKHMKFYQLALSEKCNYTFMGNPMKFTYTCENVHYPFDINFEPYFENHSFALGNKAFAISQSGHLLQFEENEVDTLALIPAWAQRENDGDEAQVLWRGFYKKAYLIVDGKLYQFSLNAKGQLNLRLLAQNLPKHEYSACIELEEQSKIFLGTRRSGLLTLSPKIIQQVFNADYCKGTYSNYAIAEIGRDSVISADGVIFTPNGIDCSKRFNRSEFWYPLAFDPETNKLFTARSRDEYGHFNLKDWTYHKDSIDLNEGHFPGPMIRHKGKLYSYIEQYGLCVYNSGRWDLLGKKLATGIPMPRQMVFESDSIIWLSTRYEAIRLNYYTGHLKGLKTPYAVSGRAISRIKDRVWFSMYGSGVFIQNGDSTLHFLPPEYPELEAVHAIVNYDDKVLFSTNNGLFEFKHRDILKYVSGEMEYIQAYGFSEEDGLLQREFNGGCQPAHLILKNGKMAFPNLTGLSFLRADFQDYKRPINQLPIIHQSYYDGRDSILDFSKEIDPDFASLGFDLIQSYFGDEDNARVYYRIPEISSAWRLLNFIEGIRLDRLPSNQTYTLEVLMPGLESGQQVHQLLNFKVGPRFVQTLTFYLALLFSALALFTIALLIMQHRNRLQKRRLGKVIAERTSELAKNNVNLLNTVELLENSKEDLRSALEMREKMIAVFSHDIRGPLRFLADIATSIKQKNPDKTIIKELEVLEDGAKSAYYTADDVLKWIKSKRNTGSENWLSLLEAIQAVVKRKKTELERYNIELSLKLDSDVLVKTNPKTLEIIIENLLQNAIKFCRGQISIQVATQNERVLLNIIDDGFGVMDPNTLRKLNTGVAVKSAKGRRGDAGAGLGLLMVSEILKNLGARIRYQNVPDGFLVQLSFPKTPGSIE